ncbi:hypothetical protein [Sorangium sp. So ce1389]|uniref:hypothetical protein n=1 Tax=Sorangium sp. So ce1389 TaxID=3133336 RepID=UPI003F63EA37
MHPALEIAAPVWISPAVLDERIWVTCTRPLVDELDAKNPGRVEYREYTKDEYVSQTTEPEKLGYHFGLVETDAPEVVAWIAERLVLVLVIER